MILSDKIRFYKIDLCVGDDGAGFVDIISAAGETQTAPDSHLLFVGFGHR